MFPRRSLGWPITLGVVMIILLVALIIGWVFTAMVAARVDNYWYAILGVGATSLGLVLVGVILYLIISIKEINLNQRQSNFIDSVTHELKSPLASLKLCLQTLSRRQLTEQQHADFHRFMLDDLERLDTLINHMLDAAKLDNTKAESSETVDVDINEMLKNSAAIACRRHHAPPEAVTLDLRPAVVRARSIDVEMIFRNLIDNAVKYAGTPPKVEVDAWPDGRGHVIVRVADNGAGIPMQYRNKIFRRFFRIGSELERAKTGTGLGLFIVRTLVKRLKGKISVYGRGSRPGTVFEVELPGRGTEESATQPFSSGEKAAAYSPSDQA